MGEFMMPGKAVGHSQSGERESLYMSLEQELEAHILLNQELEVYQAEKKL